VNLARNFPESLAVTSHAGAECICGRPRESQCDRRGTGRSFETSAGNLARPVFQRVLGLYQRRPLTASTTNRYGSASPRSRSPPHHHRRDGALVRGLVHLDMAAFELGLPLSSEIARAASLESPSARSELRDWPENLSLQREHLSNLSDLPKQRFQISLSRKRLSCLRTTLAGHCAPPLYSPEALTQRSCVVSGLSAGY